MPGGQQDFSRMLIINAILSGKEEERSLFHFQHILESIANSVHLVKDCTHQQWLSIFPFWFALFSVCTFSWFSGNVNYWNQFSDQPLLSPSLLFLPSSNSLLSCKEDIRAFLLYCYLLFSSIVFSKQTHHWHLAVLISASAICLIGFNEIKKENFVGKLETSCSELRSLLSDIC